MPNPNPYAELASLAMQSDEERLEESFLSGVTSDVTKFFSITWAKVLTESKKGDTIRRLVALITDGSPHQNLIAV